ncbi:MAG TPA: aldose 1-epimerase family protein [Chitinophagaceae bacterium]|nr:aldose 1-epimerase family protein [Chitinophagaceae bacterium]
MISIQNDCLSVAVDPKGAELKNLYNKNTGLEYMWSGDPAFWNKTSPVLFPIIGSLKNDTCYVDGEPYHMGRHGFAREMEFAVSGQNSSSISFTLVSDEDSLQKYPFPFLFEIVYAISNDELEVTYKVQNTGNSTMYFSVGGHPAFKVPLIPGSDYSDYYLEFNKKENAGRWPISPEGLIETNPEALLNNTQRLALSKELFLKDAVVFKNLQSDSVSLLSSRSPHGLRFDFPGFPYLGIWAAKHADFVCIEPWCGIADSVNSNQQLKEKEGINTLTAGDFFEKSWKVKVF